MTLLNPTETPPSHVPLEDLIPEARQHTRRRRLRTSVALLTALLVTAVASFAGGLWYAAHPSLSASDSARIKALAPECMLSNHLSLTSFHQGTAMQNVFRIVFTNHGAAACSLRGTPVLRFVNGPHRVPVGLASTRVVNDGTLTSLQLHAESSVVAEVWSLEPLGLDVARCGHYLPETGIDLTFGATTFYVQTYPRLAPADWSSAGTCSRVSTFSGYLTFT